MTNYQQIADIRAAYDDDAIVEAALAIARERLTRIGEPLTSPECAYRAIREHIQTLIAAPQERFWCLYLDNQHRIIAAEELSRGTIDQAAVYPREVARRALALGAAAVILAHNHPSGVAEPSGQDKAITDRIRQALALIDVRVLDHLVIGDGEPVSFARRGLI